MKLTGLTFENYKAFRKRESIEIRPLTILIGRNNSGKSVIARFPLLLAHAFSSRAESPLDMNFDDLDFGASFLDIVHNRNPHGAVSVGASFLSDENEEISVSAEIQYFSEYKLQHIKKFELNINKEKSLVLDWTGTDPIKEPYNYNLLSSSSSIYKNLKPIYHILREDIEKYDGSHIKMEKDEDPTRFYTSEKCPITFRGLVPTINNYIRPKKNILDEIFFYFLNQVINFPSLLNIKYLGPFRDEPKRIYEFSVGGISGRGLRGEEFLALLVQKKDILSDVSEWFANHLGNWQLDLSIKEDYFSLFLKDPENPEVEINIADAGTGIAQVLPIVVQRHLESAAGKNSRSSLEIVEQPGLHLHPGAHGPLADLYVDAVKSGTVRCLIETHSENFLLRIRRRIADGTIKPEDVIVYWVKDDPDAEERIQPIHIDVDGEVDFWPPGVFSEDFEEVREIRKAQKKRQ